MMLSSHVPTKEESASPIQRQEKAKQGLINMAKEIKETNIGVTMEYKGLNFTLSSKSATTSSKSVWTFSSLSQGSFRFLWRT